MPRDPNPVSLLGCPLRAPLGDRLVRRGCDRGRLGADVRRARHAVTEDA